MSNRGIKAFVGDKEVIVDIYPVGVLATLKRCKMIATKPWHKEERWVKIKRAIKTEWYFIWNYGIKGRRWRTVRNTFNGYLAEHQHPCSHNAGTAWSRKRALARSNAICRDKIERSIVVEEWTFD
jgi:hypothetical protein